MTYPEDQPPPSAYQAQGEQPARPPAAETPALPMPGGAAAGQLNGQAMLGALLESLAEGLLVVDSGGTILLANRRVEGMVGYSQGELLGRPLSDLLPERFAQVHTQHVADYFASPRVRPMGVGLELVARRQDETECPVDVSLSYVDTPAGPLVLALVTDTTQLRQAEQALKQRNQELDAFAHTVAHDLNASLGLLVGYSQVLLDTYSTLSAQEVRAFLTIIAQNGRKMRQIVDELLLLASMRREEVPIAPLDMAIIVDQALQRLQYMHQEYQAEIVLPPSYPRALGYAPWVEEVWLNYISNAIKYGGRPPRLELASQVQPDGYVKFWVKDNGAGLRTEQMTRLFTPHTRLGQPPVRGHGLGLSIVKRIIEKLNGRVAVESEVGQGSLFSFYLPMAKD